MTPRLLKYSNGSRLVSQFGWSNLLLYAWGLIRGVTFLGVLNASTGNQPRGQYIWISDLTTILFKRWSEGLVHLLKGVPNFVHVRETLEIKALIKWSY